MVFQENRFQQIINYIKKNITKGYTIDSLKWALLKQGYSKIEVERAIEETNEQLAKQAPRLIEKPLIKVEREPMLSTVNEPKYSFWSKLKKYF